MPPSHPIPSTPTLLLLRQAIKQCRTSPIQIQTRHATFIPRPRRPYTFTQLVALSDGSTYLHRTSSPLPVYKSTKDARNTQLWNPTSQRLMNIETDEAGRLRAFRSRFGRGWDSKKGKEIEVDAEGMEVEEMIADGGEVVESGKEVAVEMKKEGDEVVEKVEADESEEDNLLDLISSPEFDSGAALGPKEQKKKRRFKK